MDFSRGAASLYGQPGRWMRLVEPFPVRHQYA
jgi:hypothetical protein